MHLLSGLSQEKFASSWGIAIVSSPVFLVITYISLNPSSPFSFLCEVEFLKKCEFSRAKLLLKAHWLSLLKISASACGWSLPGPSWMLCALSSLGTCCSFCLKTQSLPLSSVMSSGFPLSKNPFLASIGQTNGSSTACTIPPLQHWFTLSRTWG